MQRLHLFPRHTDTMQNTAYRFGLLCRGMGQGVAELVLGLHHIADALHTLRNFGHFQLQRANGVLHAVQCGGAGLGQCFHLGGHHGKTAAGLARPCRLNARVQGQHFRLVQHAMHQIGGVQHGRGTVCQARHAALGGEGGLG